MLPRFVVRQQALKLGRRPPKVEHLEVGTTSRWVGDRTRDRNKGNLPSADYRYFRGSSYTDSTTAYCRRCAKYCGSREDRSKHKAEGDCCNILDQAYKVLKTDHLCPVCRKTTKNKEERWGVPLHKECESIFMFDLGEYQNKNSDELLKYAIGMAIREQAKRRRGD